MLRPCCSGSVLSSSLSAVSFGGAAEGPVDLFFGDLRVQGGLMDGGVGGNIGLTFGDIGGFSCGYAMRNQFQVGATFGYTWTQVEFTNGGVDVGGRANGFNLAGSLGNRL